MVRDATRQFLDVNVATAAGYAGGGWYGGIEASAGTAGRGPEMGGGPAWGKGHAEAGTLPAIAPGGANVAGCGTITG